MSTKRSKSKNKPKRRKRPGSVTPQINIRRAFQKASDAFHEDDDADKARRLLEQIESQGPMSYEVMDLYLDVLHQQRDMDHYARIATKLADRFPKDPNAVMLSASGAYATRQPVSAILAFERFLEMAPEHPGASTAREELVKLRKILPELLDAFDDSLPKTLPRIASIEKVLHLIKLGRFGDVIRRCESHLQSYPDDWRIRNNLSESLAYLGKPDEAISAFGETIRRAPENFYAHAARCRVLYLQAKFAESDADAETVMSLVPKQVSDLTKAAQAFAFRGDGDKIDWAYRQAESRRWLDDPDTEVAVLLHLQATRHAMDGDTKTARQLWKQAEAMAPGATLAGENLADLRELIGDRWGPAYFEVRDWFDQSQQAVLKLLVRPDSADGKEDDRLDRVLSGFLKPNPHLESLFRGMLDRSDGDCQRFVIILAKQSRNQETKRMLLDYVQGSRGTDAVRQHLASDLSQRGELPSPILSMHVRGKVDQLEFLTFKITDEPSVPENRSDQICEMIDDAVQAMKTGDPATAEGLFREVLQQEQGEPDVLNNLAMSLILQDRMDEADRLIDEMIKKHPDYFFGRVAAANRLIQGKQYDEAFEILIELQRQDELHETEFTALATSMIHAFTGKRDFANAERWLGMFADYQPDHPQIDQLAGFVESQRTLTKRIASLLQHS